MPKTEPFDQYADEYEDWFIINKYSFQSEFIAIKKALPNNGDTIEVGLGSGIFAAPLGIKEGIEPSEAMRKKAKKRGVRVIDAVAENLPYADKSKDATFFGTEELYEILEDTGFKINNTYQTVFGKIDEINEAQNVLVGYGQGSFVVIKAQKI